MSDLNVFNPAANTWTTLCPSGSAPSARDSFCFAAAPDGSIYLFGGINNGGNCCCLWIFTFDSTLDFADIGIPVESSVRVMLHYRYHVHVHWHGMDYELEFILMATQHVLRL